MNPLDDQNPGADLFKMYFTEHWTDLLPHDYQDALAVINEHIASLSATPLVKTVAYPNWIIDNSSQPPICKQQVYQAFIAQLNHSTETFSKIVYQRPCEATPSKIKPRSLKGAAHCPAPRLIPDEFQRATCKKLTLTKRRNR